MIKTKVAFWRAGFFPANQGFLKTTLESGRLVVHRFLFHFTLQDAPYHPKNLYGNNFGLNQTWK